MIWGRFWVLWCFVFQRFAKPIVFIKHVSLKIMLLCSGALFFTTWRIFFFGLLVAFAVALGCLWACWVWAGRPGPGTVFAVFVRSPLCRPKWSHGCGPNGRKQMVSGLFMHKKGGSQKSFHASPIVVKELCSLLCFANVGGHLLVQNGLVSAKIGVSFGVSNVWFGALCRFILGALDWVVGWLAGSGWLAGPGWLAVAGCGWLWLAGWLDAVFN